MLLKTLLLLFFYLFIYLFIFLLSAANSCPTSPRGGTTYRPPVVPDLQMAAVYAANARRDSSDKPTVVHHTQQSMSQPQTPQPQVSIHQT